jgi:hypothetical protein
LSGAWVQRHIGQIDSAPMPIGVFAEIDFDVEA